MIDHLVNQMPNRTQVKIGQLLIDNEKITEDQLEQALAKQIGSGRLLGELLVDLNFLSNEADFLPVLAGQLGVRFVKIKGMPIAREVLDLIPAQLVTHFKAIPIDFNGEVLTVATNRPTDIQSIDEINMVVDFAIKPVLAGDQDIREAIRTYYGVGADTIEKMMGKAVLPEAGDDIADIEQLDSDASISKFFNQILLEAYKDSATDIHIEPFVNELRIRYRIDGVLYDAQTPRNIWHFQDAIASRIKILSNLDITEKRVPQDGRFNVRVGNVDLDLRVSFVPTPNGESIVLRILNSTRLYAMDELGLSDVQRDILLRLMNKPNGIIFLTGPTGSGKTTTLYTCLSRLNTEDHKIITIEDPIEYQLKGITQIQINPQVGLTFAQGLRSMLRHDPDIMMVGEVRDVETAQTSIQVALTGHLIFSTLHTNDAASGIARLLDMGIDAYLISSTIQCFIAQRLVRKVCEHCRKSVPVTEDMIRELGEEVTIEHGETIYEHQGCDACHMTGYNGRDAIYEFLTLDGEIKKMILQRASANDIKARAAALGMSSLRQSGWEKVRKGITTLQEVMRVTQSE